jgi:nicotinate-nucleotide pyrophosphorylase (carboxylating)
MTVDDLLACGLDPAQVARVVGAALAEDLGPDGLDVTSLATVPGDGVSVADVVARADGVVAGLAVAATVFAQVDQRTEVSAAVADGGRVTRGDVVATVTGPTRSLLRAERTALNLLCRLSGVATRTRAFVATVAGTGARILDTRKTTPGLRALEKYAVRVGGGENKRMGLYDVAMIKDNHILAAGGVAEAYARVRAAYPDLPVQVEVTDEMEAEAGVAAGATFLLCDNMTIDQLGRVVAAVGDRAELEATGGITLHNARDYAATGVDYLSVGELTHSAPVLDIAMDLRKDSPPSAPGSALRGSARAAAHQRHAPSGGW